MLEKDIVAAIKRYLRTLGPDIFYWKEHGGQYGTAGVPDLICCYKGRFIAFEVKTSTGKTTVLQDAVIRKIKKAGGVVAVVRSVDDVKKVIFEVEKEER